MVTAGIIAEYSPLHRGHAQHIAWMWQTLGADTVVMYVMSGHQVQRGECVLTDKWSRTALALSGGADLVLELPIPWTTISVGAFARKVTGLLVATGVVDMLSFGGETGELAPLWAAAAALDGPDCSERLRVRLARGLSFPTVRQMAVEADRLASPNGNLGVGYLQVLPPGTEALTILRWGATHDGPAAGGFASASELRALLRAGRAVEVDPYLSAPWSEEAVFMAHIDRTVLARLRMMGEVNWAVLPDSGVTESLFTRLACSARTADSLEDFYVRVETKHYSHTWLRRLALTAFLGLRAAERPPVASYVWVPGFSGRGRALLRRTKEICALPVVVKPAQVRVLDGDTCAPLKAETRRVGLLGLRFLTARPYGLGWTRSPVMKECQG